ncbi:substrate-binding domain-containing protein [Ruegeria sp. HKCCC2117]|uniref:substrate-binding domain-containing protein n=1 Tax=Ruegeria sp. HKCCC2117 TaxID=2682992 RepID=UPI00147AA138|nr:substrate-binding domain-containing protein [Ruegeria sp. HKCCC2117]
MSNEIRFFVPTAIRAFVNGVVQRIEVAAGVSIKQMIDLNPTISERVSAGEEYDLGMTNPGYAKALIAAGYAEVGSHRAFGRVPLAVAQRPGRQDRVKENVEDLKALFREAESIAFTGVGTSGRTYLKALERIGLTDAVFPKSKAMGGGEPVASVAAGEAELAVAPLTTILSTPDIVLAAVFPEELGTHIDISVFLGIKAHPGASQALSFLTSSELDDELAAAGIFRFALD